MAEKQPKKDQSKSKKSAKTEKKKTSKKDTGIEQQINELTADLQRIQADFENYKRRSEQEKVRAMALGKENVMTSLLPVIDNIQRALNQVPADLVDNSYVKGVTSIAKQLENATKDIGLKRLSVEGEEFDPATMEAVAYEDGDGEREVVIEELQPGYELDGKLIRHAMVKVKKQ